MDYIKFMYRSALTTVFDSSFYRQGLVLHSFILLVWLAVQDAGPKENSTSLGFDGMIEQRKASTTSSFDIVQVEKLHEMRKHC